MVNIESNDWMFDVERSTCHAVLGQRRVLDVHIFYVPPDARDLIGGRTIIGRTIISDALGIICNTKYHFLRAALISITP